MLEKGSETAAAPARDALSLSICEDLAELRRRRTRWRLSFDEGARPDAIDAKQRHRRDVGLTRMNHGVTDTRNYVYTTTTIQLSHE